MCGIAGAIDLVAQRAVSMDLLRDMADAIIHRGPDEDGYLDWPGIGFASRRLSIIGLADGRQPIFNEDRSVAVVFNGELFDYPEKKKELEARGHTFVTHCDTELIPHLWEQYGEGMFDHLRGQFAIALFDRKKRVAILARDHFGICPLYWSKQGDWLLFGSEVKALLASGLVDARPDPFGINQIFSFFATPGPMTCFQGVSILQPGHYLRIQLGTDGSTAQVEDRIYWEIDFPNQGEEDPGRDPKLLVDEFEEIMLRAVDRRLRADVPVVSYLSGGVDSSVVVAMASKVRGSPIPTFTIQVKDPQFDEEAPARQVARHVGADPVVVGFGAEETLASYPELIRAAEAPVIDTACAALLMLAREVHRRDYKVALTGEGADEWLAGYPWYKIFKLGSYLDTIPGLELSQWLRRGFLRVSGAPRFPWEYVHKIQDSVCGHNGWLDIYGLVSMSKLRFYSPHMLELLSQHVPYSDLNFNRERMARWHPLNRALYVGARIQLPGLLLSSKGDRVAMNSSVETRYPFLDLEVFNFLARIDPKWKLRGLNEKHILRRLADRWVPRDIAWRTKKMFRAPFDSFHLDPAPPFVEQLLSEESLRKTGYFNVAAVQHWRKAFHGLWRRGSQRASIEMGLVGIIGTQLWHHTYIDGSLADLPSLAGARRQHNAANRQLSPAVQ
jgi:asparagine synthase (glutamine-hydrolysing)